MSNEKAEVNLVIDASYYEQSAVQQIYSTCAKYPEITKAVAMPDLHPGPGYPIGCAFKSSGVCFPELIGGDIGCGMTLSEVQVKSSRFKIDKVAKRLDLLDLRQSYNGVEGLMVANGIAETGFDHCLGSLGGGNHFAEMHEIHEIVDRDAFASLGLNEESTLLLVHSGSRQFGQDVVKNAADRLETKKQIDEYLAKHDHAVRWAEANRMLIGHRMMECCGWSTRKVLNIVHNYIQRGDGDIDEFVHRKGVGYVKPGEISIIPGSRGSMSYIVKMTDDVDRANEVLCSIAHGAGRRWNRSTAESHGKSKYPNHKKLLRTELDSAVVCKNTSLLYQEAPEAYKNIDDVIADLKTFKLITIVAVIKPLLTFKQ